MVPVKRFAARLGATLGALALLMPVAGCALIAPGTPESWLDRPAPDYREVERADRLARRADGDRVYRYVALEAPGRAALEPVRFTVSLPPHPVAGRLPALVALSGFGASERNLERVRDQGLNAVVWLNWPVDIDAFQAKDAVARAFAARRIALDTPDAWLAVMDWVRAQPWADPDRVVLVGVSLGAMLLPATLNRAARRGMAPPAGAILAYGGADIGAISAHVIARERPGAAGLGGWAAGRLLGPVAPEAHLPAVRVPASLLIEAEDEDQIPPATAGLFRDLAPLGTEIATLPGGHITETTPDLIAAMLDEMRAWGERGGLLNPGAPD